MTSKYALTGISMLFVLTTLTACGGGGGGGGGSAAPAPLTRVALAKTGQTTCYNTAGTVIACLGSGQDGETQIGVTEPSPRFVVGTGVGTTDQCVSDTHSGLMWVRAPSPVADTWANALTSANGLTLCGFSDWRLPNRKELRSLINYGTANNATILNGLGFTNVASDYWSSSSSAGSAGAAWIVSMFDGRVATLNKPSNSYVWPVRAGQ